MSEPKTLDPLVVSSYPARDIVDLLFLRLIDEEQDHLNFTPRLAEHWEFGEDSLTITFHMRSDVAWHDGVPVTAEDVCYTWELQADSLVAWPSRHLTDRVRDVEALDDHTVRFHYKNRHPYQLMDVRESFVVPKHIFAAIPRAEIRTSPFGRAPIGCGPYRLSSWEPGQHIVLERNPDYYEQGLPRLDRVVFRIVPDMTTLVTQLKTGEIDCLESIPLDALRGIESGDPELKIYRYLARAMTYVAWNTRADLFRSTPTRRALAMAIDAREIIRTLFADMAEPSVSPMHPILWAFDPAMRAREVAYDPDAARALLEAEGWHDTNGDGVLDRDGRAFEFEMLTNQGNQQRADVATMVQDYLRRVGVRVRPRVLEWNTFIGKIIEGDFDSCVMGWKVDTRADLSSYWKSASAPPGGFNVSRYQNAEVDALIERAKNTLNTAEARELWAECQRIIYDDQPIYFLAIPYEVVGLHRRYCGVEPGALGFFSNLRNWYIGDCE